MEASQSADTTQDTLQQASPAHLSAKVSHLPPSRMTFLSADSPAPSSNTSQQGSSVLNLDSSRVFMTTKERDSSEEIAVPQRKRRRLIHIVAIALAILTVLVVAVMIPVYLKVIKPKTSATVAPGSTSSASPTSGPKTPNSAVWGSDGSTVTATNGSTFTYNNKLGGICKYLVLYACLFLSFLLLSDRIC